MPFPTDRGYAVISENRDGTMTVTICAEIQNGHPAGTFAEHVGATNVRVDAGVRILRAGSRRYTDKIVEVTPGDGAINVRPPVSPRRSRP